MGVTFTRRIGPARPMGIGKSPNTDEALGPLEEVAAQVAEASAPAGMTILKKEGEPDIRVSDFVLKTVADFKEAFRVDCGLYDVYTIGNKNAWKLAPMLTDFAKQGLLLNEGIKIEDVQDNLREREAENEHA